MHQALSFQEVYEERAAASTTMTINACSLLSVGTFAYLARGNTFGIEPPDTATVNTPRASTESVAIVPIRRMSSAARASELDPISKVVVIWC